MAHRGLLFLAFVACNVMLVRADGYDDCPEKCENYGHGKVVTVCKCDDSLDSYNPQCYPECVNPEKYDMKSALRPGSSTAYGVSLDCECQPPHREHRDKPSYVPAKGPGDDHEAYEVRRRKPVYKEEKKQPEKCPRKKDGDHQMYCRISAAGDIAATMLSEAVAEKQRKSGTYIFYPGSRFPEENSLYYDCYCQPQCADYHAEVKTLPIHDDEFTFLHNNTYHFCLAVPKAAIDSEFYFQDNYGKPIDKFYCKSTRGISYGQDCYGWRKHSEDGGEPYFGHPCYDTWCAHAPWHHLEPHYEPHMSDEWKNVYNGAVVSRSYFKQKVKHGDEYIPVSPRLESRTFLWSVSLSIHVSAHLSDIRVYDKAHVLQYKTSEQALITGFGWGPEKEDVNVHAMIDFTTHVQKPLYLKLKSYKLTGYKTGTESLGPLVTDGCEDADNYSVDSKTPVICKQKWRLFLEPKYNVCQLELDVKLEFEYHCFDSFEKQRGHKCPYDRDIEYGTNQVTTEFSYKSEYWCRAFDTEIPAPKAKMESYACKQCLNPHTGESCATWDFLKKETPHFEIAVNSNDYLDIKGTKLNELKVSTYCSAEYAKTEHGQSNLWLVTKGRITPVGEAVGLMIDDHPTENLCLGGYSSTTTHFYFKFNELYFNPPKKLNCRFDIWAEVELEYSKQGYATTKKLLSTRLLEDNKVMAVPNTGATPPNKGTLSAQGSVGAGTPAVAGNSADGAVQQQSAARAQSHASYALYAALIFCAAWFC